MRKNLFVTPFILPLAGFAATILLGSLLLWMDFTQARPVHEGLFQATSPAVYPVSYWDALYTATSAVCVTGLATLEPSVAWNGIGQGVIMLLMQLGGLGIITYSSLIFFMLTRRVRLFDRLAVGQALLHDSRFHLGNFVRRVVVLVLLLEGLGMLALYLMEPERIGLFKAAFLAVSSFCNAGFAPWPDNLLRWQQHLGVNSVVMLLIVLGGLGFGVLDELLRYLRLRGGQAVSRLFCALRAGRQCAARFKATRLSGKRAEKIGTTSDEGTAKSFAHPGAGYSFAPAAPRPQLSHLSRLILKTTFGLIILGTIFIYLTEYFVNSEDFFEPSEVILPALFQSVTCRTAGFATVNVGRLTDLTLLAMLFLMLIGGSPGSCAGGLKTTTFRIILGFCRAALSGRTQVRVAGKGVSNATLNRVLMLLIFAFITVFLGIFALTLTEGGMGTHGVTSFQVMDVAFEVVSAFATVGLSTGITPELSVPGKLISCLLMFIGRLGPIWLITTLQQFQKDQHYRVPELEVPVG